ncbi:unnamed protein product [Calicophoron daubneyi]|uniref:beta-ketoacyl-[acyl-carrier-protein] synthase I n=1 Tax=Calicophoron daubneyi TaxID=300641 RepID=A0AAV2T9I5_CALDB
MSGGRRVVITGLGVCTSLGIGLKSFWTNILCCASGISSTPVDFSFLPCQIAGIIKNESSQNAMRETQEQLSAYGIKVDWRFLSRAAHFGIIAANEALLQAGWKPRLKKLRHSSNLDTVDLRAGVHFGVGMDGINEIVNTSQAILNHRYNGIGPHVLTRTLANMPAGVISRIWGLSGPCMANNTACATGLHSIGDAYRAIQYGEADLMLAGGCEASIFPWAMAAYSRIRAVTSKFNDAPTTASRPFDKLRDGFVMSEGAGAVVLQAWPPPPELAEYCGDVKPIAEIIGYGRTGDAHNLVAPEPSGDGAFRSMRAALLDAGIASLNEVGHVNCHATSTPLGDAIELAAISRLLTTYGDQPSNRDLDPLVINSIKGHLGHTLGAAGAIEVIYSALSVRDGLIAANCNLNDPITPDEVGHLLSEHTDENSDVNPKVCAEALGNHTILPKHNKLGVPWPGRLRNGSRVVLTNSFGFGGTNGTLILADWKQ